MSPGRYRTAADADPEHLEPSQPRRSKPRRTPWAGDRPLPAHRHIGHPHRYPTWELRNFATLSFSRLLSRRQPRARVPDLVGSRPPRPYHFPARIQSFQAVAAPFPGDSVFKSERLQTENRKSPFCPPSRREKAATTTAHRGRPEELKNDRSTNSASPKQNAQKSTPLVSAENRAQGAEPRGPKAAA